MRAWPPRYIASVCPAKITKDNVNIPVKAPHSDAKRTLLRIAVDFADEATVIQFLSLYGAQIPKEYDPVFYHLGFGPSNLRIRIVTLLLNAYYEQHGLENAKCIARKSISSFTPALFTNYEVHDLFVACVRADVSVRYLHGRLHEFSMLDNDILVEPTFAMLETVRRREKWCTSALVVLIGCCGRWRKVNSGTLRDVSNSIVKRVWETRRTQSWDIPTTTTIKKKMKK